MVINHCIGSQKNIKTDDYTGMKRQAKKLYLQISAKMFSLLPDYVLPYAIHLLAHDPELKDNTDVEGLKATRE